MDDDRALFTDLYELTMGAVYFADGLDDTATFELFVRGLPEGRNFLVAAGLEQALDYLETLKFQPHHLDFLRSTGKFDDAFVDHLESLRFTGDAWAIPEGTVFFPDEPLIRITAPRIQAQLVETFLLTCINYQSMVASKAVRLRIASAGRAFVDFSPRRDHGMDAALGAARASYIAGAAGTSNMVAAMRYGIPPSGTMAHSFVMSFEDELDAFCAYLRQFPDGATLLIDTYGNEHGVRNAIEAQKRVRAQGARLGSVRIDSGDFIEESRIVRKLLDESGLHDVRIFISGDLDEYSINRIISAGAPADAFGVGTRLGVSSDFPYLSGVYKLVEDRLGPRLKLSSAKKTLPGVKQVWRRYEDGVMHHDVIALDGEPVDGAEPLLRHVIKDGRRIEVPESLDSLRERFTAQLQALPGPLRSLEPAVPYLVEHSEGIERLREKIAERYSDRAG